MQRSTANKVEDTDAETAIVKLDQLPGPPGLPVLGNLLQIKIEKIHRIIEGWSQAYGSVFKIKLGPVPILVITAPEGIQYVLKNRPEKFRRMSKMDGIIREMGVLGVFNAEGSDWKRQRKLVSQALNVQQLKTFFPVLVHITEVLLNRWNGLSAQSSLIEIKGELMRYTVDITAQLAFGHSMNTIEKKDDVIQQHLEVIFPAIFKRMNAPVPYWRYIKLPADRKLERSIRVVNQQMQDVIDKARKGLAAHPATGNQPRNFLQALLAASGPDDPVSNQEIIGNVLTMLLAGEDTTAHTLAWIFYFMEVIPGVQQKMQQEADRVLGGEPMLKHYDAAAKLSYIEAVALESMRLKPVSPTLFHDALEDVVIEGVEVPKGTGIFLQTHAAGLKDTHFAQAEKFIPERWMEGGCPAGQAHNQKAFIPFGAGPRFCPGYQLAMLEIKALLAMVCKNFSVSMETQPASIDEVLTFTMKPSDFFVKLEKRKSNS
ncbi:MAG: cytochrome P450 [Williamsia sp.]|nr:cytochrome P450 [Williamsia sp.]